VKAATGLMTVAVAVLFVIGRLHIVATNHGRGNNTTNT